MIEGKFGDDDELIFEVELIGADSLELVIDAWLDTGFSGWLAMNSQDLEGLDWIYVNEETMQTPQGEADFDIYLGKVRIDGREFDIPVYAGAGVTEFLLGRKWLKTRRLIADLPSGVLTLGAS